MRLTLLSGLAGLLTLSMAAFAVPAGAAQPVKGAVQGTATVAKGVGSGAVQAGKRRRPRHRHRRARYRPGRRLRVT
ncbi:hypothetical protein, partial [Methyloceanibacter marginalis]|uniref:hypothetical protein n=1 Tax=Methyloceanibacter marginalis TaxID=1774971 RepID=UPI00114C913C